MLLLDTDSMDQRDAADAVQSLISGNSSTSVATFEDPESVHARLDLHDFGPGRVFNVESTGLTLRRTPRLAAQMDECTLALVVPIRSTNRLVRDGADDTFASGQLFLVDMAEPYDYSWDGNGGSYAFQVDAEALSVPLDVVHTAAHRLHHSPLYPLVQSHISQLTADAHLMADRPGVEDVGAATVELMRALIYSAGATGRDRRDAESAVLDVRIDAYIRSQLRDPDLAPAQIAAAHGISVRSLYALYASLGESLEQTIIDQRLRSAAADLIADEFDHMTIGDIAHSWGFSSPSFFSNRFRQMYGCSPSDWRATSPESARSD